MVADSFTYTISGGTATDTATLIITVSPNAAPNCRKRYG